MFSNRKSRSGNISFAAFFRLFRPVFLNGKELWFRRKIKFIMNKLFGGDSDRIFFCRSPVELFRRALVVEKQKIFPIAHTHTLTAVRVLLSVRLSRRRKKRHAVTCDNGSSTDHDAVACSTRGPGTACVQLVPFLVFARRVLSVIFGVSPRDKIILFIVSQHVWNRRELYGITYLVYYVITILKGEWRFDEPRFVCPSIVAFLQIHFRP